MSTVVKTIALLNQLNELIEQGRKVPHEKLREKSVALRESLEKDGPTFIKIGQILSNHTELFHEITCEELQKLLDTGTPIAFSEIDQILRQELGSYYSELEVEQMPIAVASIGQVHTGYIRATGEKVAIKVQLPHVAETMYSDIRTIKRLSKKLEIVPKFQHSAFPSIIKEFEAWTKRELDFTIEATNTEIFKKSFEEDPQINAPTVFRRYTTDKVITTEFIEGVTFKKALEALAHSNEDIVDVHGIQVSRKSLIEIGKNNLYKQVFENGFFHGDPHAANMLIAKTGEVYFLDFGITGKLSNRVRKLLLEMVFAFIGGDIDKLIEILQREDQYTGDKVHIKELRLEIMQLIEKLETNNSESYSSTQAFLELFLRLEQYGIQLPGNVALVGKVVASYEGTIRMLDPTINLLEEMASFENKIITDIIQEKISPENLKKEGLKTMVNTAKEFQEFASLPKEAVSALREISEEGIKIQRVNPVETTDRKILALLVLIFLFVVTFGMLLFLNTAELEIVFVFIDLEAIILGLWSLVTFLLLYTLIKLI